MPGGEEALYGESAQHVDIPWLTHGLRDRREDIVRQRVIFDAPVVRHVERSVACRAPLSQMIDANALRRDSNPDVTVTNEVGARLKPVNVEVAACGHIVPLDHDRAVETSGCGRTSHHEASLVRMAPINDAARCQLWGRVPVSSSGNEELLLDIAMPRQVNS